jgi:hypothetical protein
MPHLHMTPRPCRVCTMWPIWAKHLSAQLSHLEEVVTENQTHLETDVTAIAASVGTAVQELKDAIAAGTPAAALDFSSLDALSASTAAEAAADAPPAPPAA